MTPKDELIYRPDWNWLGRSLANYKSQQAPVAKSKGVSAELQAAKTLTEARKVVYGYKKKNVR